MASRAARVLLAEAGSGVGFCLDPLGALLVGADRIRAATPFFGGGSCSFCLSVFKCSFQVGGVTFFTYLSWKAWLMLYIFGLSLLFFGSPPVTVTTVGTRSSNSTTDGCGLVCLQAQPAAHSLCLVAPPPPVAGADIAGATCGVEHALTSKTHMCS